MIAPHAPSRRELLLASGALFAWTYMPKLARAEGRDPRFLTIVLRGALDGLAAVAPVGDPDWVSLRGDNALTGTYNDKQAVGKLWMEFKNRDFRSAPHDYVADGDKVVVLTAVTLEGDTVESADVLTYNDDGKLVAFETLGDPTVADRVFAK